VIFWFRKQKLFKRLNVYKFSQYLILQYNEQDKSRRDYILIEKKQNPPAFVP
jgi:hypothetical protein